MLFAAGKPRYKFRTVRKDFKNRKASGKTEIAERKLNMAKIDVTLINGYADMTAEEKLAALEAFEYEDNTSELEKIKSSLSKANSEAKSWKDKYNAKLSDEERKEQESGQELENLRNQVMELQKEKTISGYKAKYLADGYSEQLAEESAKALADGDMEKVFANQKAFLESHDREMKEQLLKKTPGMPGGNGGKSESEDILIAKKLAEGAVEAHKALNNGMKHYM